MRPGRFRAHCGIVEYPENERRLMLGKDELKRKTPDPMRIFGRSNRLVHKIETPESSYSSHPTHNVCDLDFIDHRLFEHHLREAHGLREIKRRDGCADDLPGDTWRGPKATSRRDLPADGINLGTWVLDQDLDTIGQVWGWCGPRSAWVVTETGECHSVPTKSLRVLGQVFQSPEQLELIP